MKQKGLRISIFCALIICQTGFSGTVVVKKNDTLYGIAKQYGISASVIEKLNELISRNLKEGQKLSIPERIENYSVKKGDNLSRLADGKQSRVDWIILINNLSSDKLKEGQLLKIPVLNPDESDSKKSITNGKPAKTVNPAPENSVKAKYYFVAKGDTLYSVSRRFGVSSDDIKKWNRISGGNLYTGEKIRIETRLDPIPAKIPVKPQTPELTDTFSFPVSKNLIRRVESSGRGIIIRTDRHADVHSINNGVVEYAGKMQGYNNVVIIKYGENQRSVFGFLTSVLVEKGNTVTDKQVIGGVDTLSFLGDVELYFEMRKGKDSVDVIRQFPFLKSPEYQN